MTAHIGTRRTRAGMTMIELVTVVVVAGAMMAIAAPRFRVSEAMQVQIAAQQVAQDLDFARTRALAARSHVRVAFNASGRRYTGFLDHDGDGSIGNSVAERVALNGFGMRELSDKVDFDRGGAPPVPGIGGGGGGVTFPGAAAEFDSRGLLDPFGSSGAVYIRHRTKPSHVAAVAITAAGSVRIWTWKNGAWR